MSPTYLQSVLEAMRGWTVLLVTLIVGNCASALKGNKSQSAKSEYENEHHTNSGHKIFDGLDIPIDAFTLHHPFIHSNITEFEYSRWYFLFFAFFDNTSAKTFDVSLEVPEIIKSLSSKLSVPKSVFSISKAEKYQSGSTSANLSLTNLTIPKLHHKLSTLQESSPLFWFLGTRYRLVQVLHSRNIHIHVGSNGQVKRMKVIFWRGSQIILVYSARNLEILK